MTSDDALNPTGRCRKCGQDKPRTAEFWERHRGCADGLRKTCRVCLRPLYAAAARRRWIEKPEQTRAIAKRYRDKHPERRAALWKQWESKNRDKINAARKEYRTRPDIRERERARNKEYQRANRERLNLYGRARRYRIGVDQYLAMIEQQSSRCAICGDVSDKLHVDHNHSNGRVRALLCSECNTGIGKFRERIELLDAARAYLVHHQEIDNGV